MTSLKKPTFSHILLSAPTEDIAEVYRAQLTILRDSVPFLREVEVNCVSDPEGQRVGSGGGTLNGLAFIRKQYNLHTLDACRILIIHSGGESRRAPLYSLCGKAWTTINATLEGGEIASPIGLLIAELSKFCVSLPLGSLVIASSDVMLDIVVDQISAVFEPNSVSLVTVPAKPTVAKNHGVIVAPKREECPNIALNVGLIQSAALNYLQKPSVKEMEQHSALYTMKSFGQESMHNDSKEELFALVDTGVVAFTGAALVGLITLLESPACAGCIAPAFLSTNDAPRNLPQTALRLELYTDLLLALRYSNQEDFSLAVYYARLGVPMPCDASKSAYDLALSVVWETLKTTLLQMILAPSGKFEHLGTTAEVLQLLTQQSNTAACAQNTCVNSGDSEESFPSKKLRIENNKLQRFAYKYGLRSSVDSNVCHPLSGAVVVNSTVSIQQSRHLEEVLPASLSASEASAVLLEHSLLVDMPALPRSAVVSHLCAPLGRDLRVQNDVMMQQVYLKQAHDSSSNAVNGVPFTLLVLSIHDDTKVHFSSSASTLCGASWDKLFQIAKIQPDSIWDTSVPTQDRCLWNARLFCASILDTNGAIFVHSADNSVAPASRLTLIWLQDLPHLNSDLSSLPAEYVSAVQQWVAARRLSLADILIYGDATRMMQWRVWLQTAYARHYHATGRVLAQLGGAKMTLDLSRAFMHLLEFEQTVQQDVPVGSINASAVLLGHWLAQLACNSAENAQDASSSVLQRAFVRFCEQMRSLGNPRIYHVISAYLKKLLLKDVDVCTVLQLLLEAVPNTSVNMHARVLFLCAWLVKDRNYYPADALSAASTSEMFRSVVSECKLRGSSSYLKACGETIISTTGADILLSIQQSTGSNGAREGGSLSVALERVAQGLVALHLQHSLDTQQLNANKNSPCINENTQAQAQRAFAPRWGVAVESKAPVRIDLAGGWSDTPPICYELSGAVLNVSVLVDHKHPIRCVSKMIAEPVLELHSTSLVGAQEYTTESIRMDQWRDFEDLSCSGETKKCLLLRAVLVAVGVVNIATHRDSGVSLSEYLQNTFSGGISVTCVSDLPAGSGMGGSSILAAAALHSLSALLGLNTSRDALVSLVSQVEQLLTTGGGWQDQVGGIFGGFKLCESPAQLPLSVNVQTLAPGPALRAAFERRVWLVYTGQQRLARNTLINALRYSALSPADTKSDHSADCPGTVAALMDGAHIGWNLLNSNSEGDSVDDQLDNLSAVLNSYWELKTEMAAGSEPPHIAHLLSQLRPLCSGLSLCGAGAGGFASVVLRRDVSVSELRELIDTLNAQNRTNDADLLSLHTVSIDCSGIYAEEQPLP